MSYAERAMIAGNIAVLGSRQTGVLRRRHQLQNRRGGAMAGDELAVQATTAAGGSSLPIKATSGTLKGVLKADFTFTVAGNATVYTLSASATTTTSGVLTVSFTPVLAAEATLDAAITLGADYIDGTFTRLQSSVFAEDEASGIDGASRVIHLSAQGSPFTPLEGDVWTDTSEAILSLRTYQPGVVLAGWSATIGKAA